MGLLKWYPLVARELPWRTKQPNPYHIWISEVMSQQSTLKMMLPYFERWMQTFPRLEDLARASESQVLKLWEGLGYYSRARNLHKASRLLMQKFPEEPGELVKLPGIGAYTAAAIASIAFDFPSLPVDGNVTRVLARLFAIPDPLNNRADLAKVHELARDLGSLFPAQNRGTLAQAFMELGASLCRAGAQARCFECPLKKHCLSYEKGCVASVPKVKIRKEMKAISRLLLIYRNSNGEPLIRLRPEGVPLGGQWELPYLDLEGDDLWIRDELSRHFETRKAFSHTIMNQKFKVWPLELGLWPKSLPSKHRWMRGAFKGTLTTITRKFHSAK